MRGEGLIPCEDDRMPRGVGVAGRRGRCDGTGRIEKNVVYGMYSGLALLMDVHVPAKSNGRGVLFVAGNAWQSPLAYSAASLKDGQVQDWAPSLLSAGYTVFAINHRAAPRFHYPAPVEDVQRAVRFIRHNARQYGIDGTKLGAAGGSSGGHLVGWWRCGSRNRGDSDPVNREPAAAAKRAARALRLPKDDRREHDCHRGGRIIPRRYRR